MRITSKTVALALAAATAGTVLATVPAHAAQATTPDGSASLQKAMDALVATGEVAGVQARLTENGGQRVLRAGTARIDGKRPVPADGLFRMGSATKIFTATTVLHLVGEGRIKLDEPIATYLPGLLPRENDITVRMILRHTAGLPNYTDTPELPTAGEPYLKLRFSRFTDERLLAFALAKPMDFEPGARFSYSNTGYVVAGMLIKAVTGNTWQSEVTKRVIEPLGLRDTSAPVYSTSIPGRHAHGYVKKSTGQYVDVSRLNPSIAGAGGAMITTTADLTAFLDGLVSGKILKPAQFAEMNKSVFVNEQLGAYGLGLRVVSTSCGRQIIGHTGGIPGYTTAAFTTPDGRTKLALSVNEKQPQTDLAAFEKAIDSAFCA
jgi:D-alanyl-D-alanine carboxypeptidase